MTYFKTVFLISISLLPVTVLTATDNALIHAIAFCIALFLNFISLFININKHRNIWPIYTSLWGLISLSAIMLLPYLAGVEIKNHPFAFKISLVGSIALLIAHYFDNKFLNNK